MGAGDGNYAITSFPVHLFFSGSGYAEYFAMTETPQPERNESFTNHLAKEQGVYLIEIGLYKNRDNIHIKTDANFKLSTCYGALHCF